MFPVTQSTGFIIGTRLHTVIADAGDVKAQKGKVRRSGESPPRDGDGKPMRSPWRAPACVQHGPVVTAISKKSWDSRDANWDLGRKTGTPAFLPAPLIPMTQAPCRSQPPTPQSLHTPLPMTHRGRRWSGGPGCWRPARVSFEGSWASTF